MSEPVEVATDAADVTVRRRVGALLEAIRDKGTDRQAERVIAEAIAADPHDAARGLHLLAFELVTVPERLEGMIMRDLPAPDG